LEDWITPTVEVAPRTPPLFDGKPLFGWELAADSGKLYRLANFFRQPPPGDLSGSVPTL
jgi:hypothetical protein